MISTQLPTRIASTAQGAAAGQPTWLVRTALLWKNRRLLAKVTGISLIGSLAIAFAIPKEYKSVARIMPPDQSGSGAMMLAALASRSTGLGALGTLAGGLLGSHSTTALFIDLLRSGTIGGHLIDRFNLQQVYGKRYRIDTAKHLARNTKITDDKKSGVITIEVIDWSPERARDLAQAYLQELNQLVTSTNASAAHRERVFIEARLAGVQHDLEQAQLELSDFSSRNSTVDIKEQTRAMVDAGARVQGELLVAQSGLQSLRQIYGDGNIRVRETQARIATLQKQLQDMAGSSGSLTPVASGPNGALTSPDIDKGELYPQLRQIPRLAVPLADLYRRVKVQETVFELLTQEYEMARIDEVKDVPVVSVIDAPGIPEKKSFPPRLLLTLLLTFFCFAATSVLILARARWEETADDDPGKQLGAEMIGVVRGTLRRARIVRRGEV